MEPDALAEAETKTFPYARQCPFTPPKEYAEMIEKDVSQVTLDGSGLRIWTVTGYQTIRELLTDPRVSASRKHDNFPFYFVAPPEYRTETSFIGYDGKEHSNTRRKAALTFTNRQVQRLRPRVEEIVDDHLDKLLAMEPPVDFHRVFSLAVPMTVICELLGIPQDQHDFFIKHGTALLGGHSSTEERQAAIVEVNAYISDLIQQKKAEPGEDLLSRAMADYEASGEEYTDRDLFNMVRLLMNGGHETTASQISLGTACLLENPDQLELLLNDPSLVRPAVEELVRFATIGDTAVPRVALEASCASGWPPTATPRSSRSRRSWTSPAAAASTWASGTGCTTASAPTWRGWSWRSSGASCSSGSRPSSWPSRSWRSPARRAP
jgi:cytochrome P450